MLDFTLQTGLVFDSLAAVSDELLSELLDFVSLLFQLLNSLAFRFYHLLEVVALENQVWDGFFVVGFVSAADFDQNIQSFVLKERKSVLVLHLLNFLLDFCDLLLLFFDFLLVFQLTLVVVLYYF